MEQAGQAHFFGAEGQHTPAFWHNSHFIKGRAICPPQVTEAEAPMLSMAKSATFATTLLGDVTAKESQ
eukprot:8105567-Heterocapsa_arctica.AAC.1